MSERLVDLTIKQVTEGLSAEEQRELDSLDQRTAAVYRREFETAAAALALVGTGSGDAPPDSLRRALEQQALAFAVPATAAPLARGRPSPRRYGALGWWAAAACLVLALAGWLRAPPTSAPVAALNVTPPPAVIAAPPALPPPPPAPPTDAEARAALLAREDSLKVTLAATKDPAAAGVNADVVWDPATQTGYVHLTGLAANDPRAHQYQLWVFDAARDKRYPVDGGVFDVPADASEAVVPIRAALYIQKPAAFAITLEQPGGVVVSKRDHVVALGAAG